MDSDAGPLRSFHRLDKAEPGRFLLYRRAHPEWRSRIQEPYERSDRVPDALDQQRRAEGGIAGGRRLGPQVLKLSATRSASHTVSHDARAHATAA